MVQLITEVHKECLRQLLKLVREGTIPEEFRFEYLAGGPVLLTQKGNTSEQIRVNGLSRLGLEALTRTGYLFSIPNYSRRSSSTGTFTREYESESSRSCYITPEGIRAVDSNFSPSEDILLRRPPIEITSSLSSFRNDFPDSSRLAFVMMQFGSSNAHATIISGIRNALEPHQFFALRADDKQYHDNLFFNILTYVYGCRFGISVFERIESDEFNPNVSLEVGYMLGLGKPVCYLKDRTLKTLPTDLIGQLYREFDPQDCKTTIPSALWKWMEDKGLMSKRVEVKS